MPRLRDLAHGLVLASVEDSKQFINSANSQGLKRYAPLSMMVEEANKNKKWVFFRYVGFCCCGVPLSAR